MSTIRLRRELRSAGSSAPEAEHLAGLAQNLGKLPVPHLRSEAKEAIAEHIGINTHRYHLYNRMALATGFALVVFVVATAWFTGPGSNLYGVKGLTNFFHAKPQATASQKLAEPANPMAQPLQPVTTNQSTSGLTSHASTPPETTRSNSDTNVNRTSTQRLLHTPTSKNSQSSSIKNRWYTTFQQDWDGISGTSHQGYTSAF